MKLIFDDQAAADLEGIFNWISQDSPAAARKVTDRLLEYRTADFLSFHGACRE